MPQAPLSNNDFVFLSDATILLLDNENVVDSLTYDASKNRYESSLIVQEGANFDIRVSHPRYNTLNANLYPFQKVLIKSIGELQTVTNDNTSLKFTIDDPQSTNYYMINLKAYYSQEDIDTSDV